MPYKDAEKAREDRYEAYIREALTWPPRETKKFCLNCEKKIYSNNMVGYCRNSFECRLLYNRMRMTGAPEKEDYGKCKNCGKLLHANNTRGFCRDNPECIILNNRIRSTGTAIRYFCEICGKEMPSNSQYGVCSQTAECLKVARRRVRLLCRYNLHWNEYERLLHEQNRVCALCLAPPKPTRMLAVDHDHRTGRIRGLLCDVCNSHVLGIACRDNELGKQGVIEYALRLLAYASKVSP